jgi:hypothetical protein
MAGFQYVDRKDGEIKTINLQEIFIQIGLIDRRSPNQSSHRIWALIEHGIVVPLRETIERKSDAKSFGSSAGHVQCFFEFNPCPGRNRTKK